MASNVKNKILNTPTVGRKTFSKHFLRAVYSEIGFAGTSVHTILTNEESLKAFFQSQGFDISKRVTHREVLMKNPEDNKPAKIAQKETPLGLIFSSSKPRIDVQILDTKIIISDFNYEGFDSFNARFKALCEGISKFVPRNEVRKVGLRKVDSIAIEPVKSYQDACAIFNPAIFAIIRSGLIQDSTLKAHEEALVIEKQGVRCILRARMNQISETAYESSLDFDFVDIESVSLDQVFANKLPELNNRHFEIFMWAASDELIKLMEST
jgi:uncharacterized protein (TIGR04255 family)